MTSYYDKNIHKTEIKISNITFRLKTPISINSNFHEIIKLPNDKINNLHKICLSFINTNDKKLLIDPVKNIFNEAIIYSRKKKDILIWINTYFNIITIIQKFIMNYDSNELKYDNNLIYYL